MPVHPTRVRHPSHSGLLVPDTSAHHPQNAGRQATYDRVLRPTIVRDGGHDASPTEKTLRASRTEHPGVIIGLRHTVSYDVNATPLKHAPNPLNILHIHAGNANATVDLAVTILNNLELKRDAVQTENDLPAQ